MKLRYNVRFNIPYLGNPNCISVLFFVSNVKEYYLFDTSLICISEKYLIRNGHFFKKIILIVRYAHYKISVLDICWTWYLDIFGVSGLQYSWFMECSHNKLGSHGPTPSSPPRRNYVITPSMHLGIAPDSVWIGLKVKIYLIQC
jgi:hypothetical protein